ncbi:hypothetical protein UMNK88_pEnt62 (plasmid) [Escherichia coli UMNK88]|nr:hypothetical protein UMNK88_pEnt62 [Escherichia coli UMNK88]
MVQLLRTACIKSSDTLLSGTERAVITLILRMFIFISVVSVYSVIRKINRTFPDFFRQGSIFRINFRQTFICGYHPDTFHFSGQHRIFPGDRCQRDIHQCQCCP